MTDFASVVQPLLRRLGIDDDARAHSGVISLYLDDDLPVYLRQSNDGDALVLHAGIGALADADPVSTTVGLLEGTTVAMDQQGFALGIVPETDLVLLIARRPLDELDEDRAVEWFDRFAAASAAWRVTFDALVSNASDEESERPAADTENQYKPKLSDMI